ncbi:two-partner secretion domain-containing protein, partial [Ralstonia pseudosolanacearum]
MRQPVTARARAALEQPCAIALQQEQHGASAGTADPVSRHDRARRSFVARSIAAAVALISWLGPVQVSWQAARQSAATIALHGTTVDSPFTSWRTTGRLLVRWGLRQAQAGAITDPTAPIRFTPTLTQTTGQGGGVPAINITTPNQSGLSYNLLRSLTVDGIGLILNNSLAGGGTLLGGNVGGNANLATSGPASTILTQVTGTDPIRINGTVEVFGAPASVIFAAPAGIYTQGAGFTNTPRVTLSSGTPQFLNGSGANVSFDQATAVGFLVNSGRIQIDPAAGSTAGAGIEGTVGAINLIGQTVGVNAPLYAGNQISVIAGNQQVAPVATGAGRAGSDWQVSGAGANAAANSASAQNGLAIDATAFGAMTAGQIKLISTAQGLGVRAAGDLAANTSNVNIDANGDVSVGNVYGQQSAGITTTGAVSTSGAVRAHQDVTIGAGGDVTLGGAAQAGNNVTVSAGGNVAGSGNLAAAKALNVSAGKSVNLGGNLNAASIAVTAQGKDGTGDVTLGGKVASPGGIALNAARDTTIAGQLTGSGDLNIGTQRNLLISGSVATDAGSVGLSARTGRVQVTGSVVAPQDLTVTAGTDAQLGGTVTAGRHVTIDAQRGSADLSGTLTHNGNLNVSAAQDISASGRVQTAGAATLQARAGTVGINGKLVSNGDLQVTAGQDVAIDGAAQSTGKIVATAGRSLSVGGTVAAAGDARLTAAAGTLSTSGTVQAGGSLDASAQGPMTLGGSVSANRAVTAQSTGADLRATGTLTAHGGNLALTGATDANVTGVLQSSGDTAIAARQGSASLAGQTVALGKLTVTGGQSVAVLGTTQSVGDTALAAAQGSATIAGSAVTGGNLAASAGADVAVSGTAQSGAATSLTAGRDLVVSGPNAITANTTFSATAGRNLSIAGSTLSGGDTQLSASGGTLTTSGQTRAGGNVGAVAQGDVTLGGTVYATQNVEARSSGARVMVPGVVTAQRGNVSLAGATDVGITGATQSAGNTTVAAMQGSANLGGAVLALGNLTAAAGQDMTVTGSAQSVGSTSLTAGRDASFGNAASVISGTALTALAGRNLTAAGTLAASGDAQLRAGGGSLSTSGAVLSGGSVTAAGQGGTTLGGTVYAAKDVSAQSAAGTTSATGSVIAHGGHVSLVGTSVAVTGATQSAGDTTLNATQGNAALDGQVAALGKLGVSATQDITGQGRTASVGDSVFSAGRDIALTGSSQAAGNFVASAANALSIAALPLVGGSATLSGAAVSLGSVGKTSQVNGTLSVTGTQGIATAGTINTGSATLKGGAVTNAGTVTASNALGVTGTTITNTGTLGGATTTVHGTAVVNSGLIGGQAVSVTADSAFNNQGGTVLGLQALNVAAGTLDNRNGTIFAGRASGTAAGADLNLTASGANGSFNNAGGQIAATGNATLNLANQTIDGASANLGTINAGNQLTYNVGAVANTGNWTLGGQSATVNAGNGISNTGAIQHAGNLTLTTPGAISNSGQIVAGKDLALSGGRIGNAAGATLHADRDLSINGATTNRGTVEALNDAKIAGASYDNAGALTQANRDVTVNVSGTVLNQGGTIGAGRDVNLTAGQIVNDATVSGGASTTVVTGQEINPTYLSKIVIGREQLSFSLPGGEQGSPDYMAIYRAVTIGDLKPDANGVIYGYLATELVRSLHDQYVDFWHLGSMVDHPATALATLPTVTRTETTTQAGVSGIIRAGRNLAVTASTLSNNGGQISAAGNITMAVGTLNNGAAAGATKTITESIDGAVLNSFMAQLYDALHSGTKPLFSDAVMSDGCSDGCPTPHWFVMQNQVVPGTFHTVPAATPPAPQTTVQQTAGKQGVIAAGGNIDLTQTGTLNNGGQIAAAGNVALGGSVNNVGQLQINRTTLPGCVGNPANCVDKGVAPGGTGSPYNEVIDPKQQVASIIAGGALTANLSQLTNQTGTIAASGNVQITAPAVTNTGGTIQSTAGSVTISAANSLVNQAAPTTTVYQSQGDNMSPCGKVGGTACATATQSATGDAGMILAAGDLTIHAGAVRNNGGAIVAGGNNTITTGSFDNSSIFLRRYYHWSFSDQNANVSDRWGCDAGGDISGCQRVFGGNLSNGTNANAENAPTIGVLNSYVRGGNLAIRAGGAIVNSGNIEGTAVALSGASITNGITNPSIQTPPSTSGRQVVSLGPIGTPNAQLPATGTPDTFSGPTTVLQQGVPAPASPGTTGGLWTFNPVIVTSPTLSAAQAGPSGAASATVPAVSTPQAGGAVGGFSWHFNTPLAGNAVSAPAASVSTAQYLSNSPATAVLGGVGPQTLINALPAELRPGGTPFYYDPQVENQRLDQAALAQTGRTSFINGLAYDSQTHLTADDQQKLILYQNAVDYAKAHNVQLGQALTPGQLAALDKPMLWYVTQQVPDPNCLSSACPMVSALVPQVYLPPGYSGIEPGGSIVASKSLELLADNPIRNTGTLGSY